MGMVMIVMTIGGGVLMFHVRPLPYIPMGGI